MNSITFILKNYVKKDGGTFGKATCKGEFLPLATALVDEYYQVKFSSKSLSPMPLKEGVYEVSFEDNGLWIDTRPEFVDKKIVRVNAVRVVFKKALAKTE